MGLLLVRGVEIVETVVKAILVLGRMETGTIGFLPRHIMARGMMAVERFMEKFAHIIELYDLCYNSMKKKQEFQKSRDSSILPVEQQSRGGVVLNFLILL